MEIDISWQGTAVAVVFVAGGLLVIELADGCEVSILVCKVSYVCISLLSGPLVNLVEGGRTGHAKFLFFVADPRS